MPDLPAGQNTEVTLDAGEVLQWINADPTGTVVDSDHPIAAFGGDTNLGVRTLRQAPEVAMRLINKCRRSMRWPTNTSAEVS